MPQKSLGIIETIGLTAAVEAADAAVKSADVKLVGYELTKGSGMTTIKVEGNVGAVKAAVDAAAVAASRVSQVVSARVIARPNPQIDILIRNGETVGCETGESGKTESTPVEPARFDQPAPEQEAKPEESEESDVPGEAETSEDGLEDEPGEVEEGVYTCNICKDPNCPRKKGDLRELCIHYRKKK